MTSAVDGDSDRAAVERCVTVLRAAAPGLEILTDVNDLAAATQIWNGAVSQRPAALARCRSVEDVQLVVRSETSAAAPLSVLSGGYDWAGRSIRDGGMVVALRATRDVIVGEVASIQGGAHHRRRPGRGIRMV